MDSKYLILVAVDPFNPPYHWFYTWTTERWQKIESFGQHVEYDEVTGDRVLIWKFLCIDGSSFWSKDQKEYLVDQLRELYDSYQSVRGVQVFFGNYSIAVWGIGYFNWELVHKRRISS